MSTNSIPAIYKIWFRWIDPSFALSGAYMNFFTPQEVMKMSNPSAVHTRAQDILFQQSAGALVMIAFLSAFLLRYSKDVTVWKLFQASVLMVDISMLYSFYDSLQYQGRLDVDKWVAGDWTNVGVTGWVTVLRIAFLLGIGLRGGAKAKGN